MAQRTDVRTGSRRRRPTRRLVVPRLAVGAAAALLALSTLSPTFSAGRAPALAAPATAVWLWAAGGAWVLCPVALVVLGVLGVARSVWGDAATVGRAAMPLGLGALGVVALECAHVGLFGRLARGEFGLLPAAGTYLALVAALVLVAWPRMWARADLRRRGAALGGRVTPRGGWEDPDLLWEMVRPAPSAAPLRRSILAARLAPPAGWYLDPEEAPSRRFRWWDGVAWTEHRADSSQLFGPGGLQFDEYGARGCRQEAAG